MFYQYTDKTQEEVLELLNSSDNGLSKKGILLAEEKYGFNEIKTRDVVWIDVLIRQFKSPFFYLLLIAVIISLFIGDKIDSLAILTFVFLNVAIGFFQEYKAERAVSLLKKIIPARVKVLRDKKEQIIDKKFLVPGDIVFLMPGDIVPADLRILELHNFLVDESVLTGESSPVSKIFEKLSDEEKEVFRAKNIIFSGTSVISGKATGVVVGTGKETVFGEIIKSVSLNNHKESVYEKNILYFSKLILKIVVTTIAFIFAVNILLKGIDDFFELLLFSVALIVSILPEAFPAVVTFSLSKGSLQMAKRNVVVKRLAAIEDLGNIEVLCTDKTGTLTQNKLSLEKIVSFDKKKCFLYTLLTFNFSKKNERILNPFDYAVSQRVPENILKESKKFNVVSESLFNSFKMTSSYIIESSRKERFLIVKGAPEIVLKNCSKFGGNFDKKELLEDTSIEGEEGKRTLAIAYKKVDKDKNEINIKDEKDLTFLGYFVFEDPLKPTAKEAIDLAKKLGVQIKIITGDSKEVAGYTARRMGLVVSNQEVISGEDLEKISKEDFDYACQEKIVFARISPDIKHNIIKSLQKRYEVGFIGEGINDAPALKTANVGIAVAEASDIARESSDVVLLQKDLRVIVNGIKDGRAIFANINKYIKCALASNFGNFYSIAVISLFIDFLPMLPVQILLGNILSDFPLISTATDSVDIEELRRPKLYQLHMVLPLIISLALVSTIFDFIFFAIFNKQPAGVIQTLWFIESILTEILLIFIIRTKHKFWKAKRPSFWLMSFAIIDFVFVIMLPFLSIGQEWFHFVTPPILSLLIVLLCTVFYFFASEAVKLIYFRYWSPH